MSSKKSNFPSLAKIYHTTWQTFNRYPVVIMPYVIFVLFEFFSLILLYLAPRMPLRFIFGPLIRTFWGERFLHYPVNFLLLPKLHSLARMGLSIVFGSLVAGITVILVYDIDNKQYTGLKAPFTTSLKKYISLFAIVFILTLSFYVLIKMTTLVLTKYFLSGHSRLLFLGPRLWLGSLLICINFILALFIQSALIYAIPVLLLEKERLVKSVLKSLVLFKKLFIPTLALVGLPMLVYIPIIVLDYNTIILIDKIFPEFILWVLIVGTLISSLIIDPAVTVSTTLLYLIHKEKA